MIRGFLSLLCHYLYTTIFAYIGGDFFVYHRHYCWPVSFSNGCLRDRCYCGWTGWLQQSYSERLRPFSSYTVPFWAFIYLYYHRSDRSFEPIKSYTSIFSMPNTSVWDLCQAEHSKSIDISGDISSKFETYVNEIPLFSICVTELTSFLSEQSSSSNWVFCENSPLFSLQGTLFEFGTYVKTDISKP